nr:aminoglycoside phosphotransferase family protein [Kutzneria buriramensis]
MTTGADETEEPLAGGHDTAEVVRVGDTVRRTRRSGSPFAEQVLRHLEAVGYPHAPRFRGVDDRGRDILTYVPGRTTDHPSQRAEGAYRQGGAMLRRLHDATAGHRLAGGRECVVHGDPGPFNTIFQDGRPVAFIDWTGCAPGDRLDDVAYQAWTWCIQTVGNVPVADQVAHLRELCDGYGGLDLELVVAAMVERQTRLIDTERANAADADLSEARRDHARIAVAWATDCRALVREHLIAAPGTPGIAS